LKESAATDIRGIGVSPGVAIGKAHLLEQGQVAIPFYKLRNGAAVVAEVERFERAVAEVEKDLEAIKQKFHPELIEHAHILEAHQLILRDPQIYDQTIGLIRDQRLNAQWALKQALIKVHDLFKTVEDDYLRARVKDVDDVGQRVLRSLAGFPNGIIQEIRERVIIVARDLSPADTAQLQLERTLGLVIDMGGRTSHTSIIARSLNIPAVVATEKASRVIRSGDLVIIDGASGKVIVNPTEAQLSYYYEVQDALENYLKQIRRQAHLPARTLDGHTVRVEANIELLEEVVASRDNGAESIGLYRTEFFLLNRDHLPSEETLYNEYRELAELMAPRSVNLRTLDLGAEKMTRWAPRLDQANPALGLRAIRLCLHHKDLFKTQLRAILRAGAAAGNIRLLFPLISGVGELLQAKAVLNEVREELRSRRIPFDERMKVGIMIEVPSAVAVADLLAPEVDFFSIGTNDLIQYSLAIDRGNEHVAYLYEPLHPAVLRFIRQTVEVAHRARLPVTVCGEMAAEPLYVPILLGLKVDSMSMNPQAIPRVKNLICRSRLEDCRRFVDTILGMRTAQEIGFLLRTMVLRNFPEEFKFFDPDALTPKEIFSKA